MIKKFTWLFSAVLLAFLIPAHAQTKVYLAAAGEWIFSLDDMDAAPGVDVKPVLRFSAFFNSQQQIHFDFTHSVGIYSGLGIRNIGFINKFGDSLRVKERSYSLGLPLVLKLGDLEHGINVGIGGEVEWMFAWKRKIFLNDSKTKYDSWFSDNVNAINPSLLFEVKFHAGQYIRFKYYLRDFLQSKGDLILPNNGGTIPGYATTSKLFYISIGSVFLKKPIKSSTAAKSDQMTDAFFKTSGKGRL